MAQCFVVQTACLVEQKAEQAAEDKKQEDQGCGGPNQGTRALRPHFRPGRFSFFDRHAVDRKIASEPLNGGLRAFIMFDEALGFGQLLGELADLLLDVGSAAIDR
jgi:hypothetical protein